MSSPQTIEKQQGNQAMSHHNTVFSQLLKLISRHEFESLAKQHHTGRSFRTASRWSQFVVMTMAQLSGRCSLRDIVDSISSQAHRLLVVQKYHAPIYLASMKINPMRFMRHYLESYSSAVREQHQGMISASIIHFTRWMLQRLIYVYLFFPGQISERQKVPSNYMLD